MIHGVLFARSKIIVIGDQQIKLFTLDGRLWVQHPADLKIFKSRRQAAKAGLQSRFAWVSSREEADAASL